MYVIYIYISIYKNIYTHTYLYTYKTVPSPCQWFKSHVWTVLPIFSNSASWHRWVMSHMEMRHIPIWMNRMCHVTHEPAVCRNKSCYLWTCHVTWECITSLMNASRHVWKRHVTSESVTSHMNASRHILHMWMRHVKYNRGTLHINAPYHIWVNKVTYEGVMSRMKESRHI